MNTEIDCGQDGKKASGYNCIDSSHIHTCQMFQMVVGDATQIMSESAKVPFPESDL